MLKYRQNLVKYLLSNPFFLLNLSLGIIDVQQIIQHNLTRINNDLDIGLLYQIKSELHHAVELGLNLTPDRVDFPRVKLKGLIELLRRYFLVLSLKLVLAILFVILVIGRLNLWVA